MSRMSRIKREMMMENIGPMKVAKYLNVFVIQNAICMQFKTSSDLGPLAEFLCRIRLKPTHTKYRVPFHTRRLKSDDVTSPDVDVVLT